MDCPVQRTLVRVRARYRVCVFAHTFSFVQIAKKNEK